MLTKFGTHRSAVALKGMTGRLVTAALVGIVGLVMGLPAAAGEYYKVYSNAVDYIAWTEDSSGRLEGQFQEDVVDGNDPTKLKTSNGAFTGVRHGSGISITFSALFLKQTWTGTIGAHKLTLVRPSGDSIRKDTFLAGSYEDYQAATARLRKSVTAAQASRAYQQTVSAAWRDWSNAVNHVGTKMQELRAALDHPPATGLLAKYQRDYAQLQADLAPAQGSHIHTFMICRDRNFVASEWAKVANDAAVITNADRPNRQALTDNLRSMTSSMNPHVMDARAAWPTLTPERARRVVYSLTGQSVWSDEQFSQWQADVAAAQDRFDGEISDFTSTETSMEAEAERVGAQATQLVSELTCNPS